MKEILRIFVYKWPIALAVVTLAVTGCGGGGGGSSGTSTSTSSTLSAAQKNYESVALASNGGLHYPEGLLEVTTSSSGALSVNTASSYFFTRDVNVPQSPSNGVQTFASTYTSLSSALAVPTITPSRYLVNGAVVVMQIPDQIQVSYSGNNVLESYLATDGKTISHSLYGTSYTIVPLSGPIASSPSELFTNSAVGIITDTVNGQAPYNTSASWLSGAAYVRVNMQAAGDTLQVGDCVAPTTTGSNTTPCSTAVSTLEAFFPYASSSDGVTYQLSGGQIVTLNGVRAWVSNTPANFATTQYRVFYQNNGSIYSGYLEKDGTPLEFYPAGSQTPTNGYIFLNGAAVQSLQAATQF
jgi:hypothetical protein